MLHTANSLSALQAAEACYRPKDAPPRPPVFQPSHLYERTCRVLPDGARPPTAWSDYEAMQRTGIWASTAAPRNNGIGGAHRRLPLYAADKNRTKKGDAEGFDCTKHQNPQGAMSPGVMVCCPPILFARWGRLRKQCRSAACLAAFPPVIFWLRVLGPC